MNCGELVNPSRVMPSICMAHTVSAITRRDLNLEGNRFESRQDIAYPEFRCGFC
jgi:hypothetical protein